MNSHQLLSRRRSDSKVDFRPTSPDDVAAPYNQLRRLSALLSANMAPRDDVEGCDDALEAYREFCYRKIFTGTTHEQYLEIEQTDPQHIDWIIAVHNVDAENFRNAKEKRRNDDQGRTSR